MKLLLLFPEIRRIAYLDPVTELPFISCEEEGRALEVDTEAASLAFDLLPSWQAPMKSHSFSCRQLLTYFAVDSSAFVVKKL